jgi:hypothetical protein
MVLLLITYNLRSSDDIAALCETVAALGPCTRVHSSFLVLSTSKSIECVRDTLCSRFEFRSALCLTELSYKHIAYLPKETLDWLAAHRHAIP